MPFIPRQVKPPARIRVTCKVPHHIASLLKCYAEYLDSSQEYVVTETLQLAFRKDREFQAWLTTTHPELVATAATGSMASASAVMSASITEGDRDTPRSQAGTSSAARPAAPRTVASSATEER